MKKLVLVLMSFCFVLEVSAACIPEWIPFVGGFCFWEEVDLTEDDILWTAKLLDSSHNQMKAQGGKNECDYNGVDKYQACFFGASCVSNIGDSCGGTVCINAGFIDCEGSCVQTRDRPAGTPCGIDMRCDNNGNCLAI